MKIKVVWITALFFVIGACAVITVNIYFPEKDVKEAYKTLEKELMAPAEKEQEKKEEKKDEGIPLVKPESSIRFEFVGTAYAAEAGLAERIAEIVKKMPDVVNAYKSMGARTPETERLRDSGAVGEGNNGLLAPRKTLSPSEQKIVDAENADREVVMKGMARAIIRINRLPENEENLKRVLPQATEEFAAIRRDASKKGWWVQDKNGNWNTK